MKTQKDKFNNLFFNSTTITELEAISINGGTTNCSSGHWTIFVQNKSILS